MDRNELFRASYGRGIPLLGYGLIWLAGTVVILSGLGRFFAGSEGLLLNLLLAVMAAGLVGGIGGATGMLKRLGQHIAIDEDLVTQSVVLYFLQPIAGVIGGGLVFAFIAVPGSLLVNFVAHGQLIVARSFSSATFTAIYLLLAWTGGYYQQQVYLKLKSLLKKQTAGKKAVNLDAPFSFKAWYRHQQEVFRWSFTWGLFILFYAVLWLAVLVYSYVWADQSILTPEPASAVLPIVLLLAAWPTAAAGGIGGTVNLLHRLYQRVSYEQNFDRQELMWYLVQPVVGIVFGLALYLLVASGYLALQPIFSSRSSLIVDLPPVVMLQILLGWIAGFRQQLISDLILKLVGDVVSFVKLVLKLVNPLTLFNKTKREQVLAEIGRQHQIFKPIATGSGSNDGVKWWAPD